jgi:large subunit ribosomal protein L31
MKQSIHPQYFDNCTVTCACGHTFITGSTLEKIEVEVCSKCHPFFTGQHKFVDSRGRIEKFQDKVTRGKSYQAKKTANPKKKKPSIKIN